jgi:hypothetical protein
MDRCAESEVGMDELDTLGQNEEMGFFLSTIGSGMVP